MAFFVFEALKDVADADASYWGFGHDLGYECFELLAAYVLCEGELGLGDEAVERNLAQLQIMVESDEQVLRFRYIASFH